MHLTWLILLPHYRTAAESLPGIRQRYPVVCETLQRRNCFAPPHAQPFVSKPISQSTSHSLHSSMSFDTVFHMEDRKKKLLTAKISVALLDELGRIPTKE